MRKPEQKINGMPQFHGPFRELIPDYITYKEVRDINTGSPVVYHLREMDLFFMEMGVQDIRITRKCMKRIQSLTLRKKKRPPRKDSRLYGDSPNILFLWDIPIFTPDTMIPGFLKGILYHIFFKRRDQKDVWVLEQSCVESPVMRMMRSVS